MMGYSAFTARETVKASQLKSQITILGNQGKVDTIGLWDTGASASCISIDVAKQLALIPTGRQRILTPGGVSDVNTYMIDVILPNNVRINNVVVSDSQIGNQGIGMLIGMDIIGMGSFAVTTTKGKTTFSFVIPAIKEIDFVPVACSLSGTKVKHK